MLSRFCSCLIDFLDFKNNLRLFAFFSQENLVLLMLKVADPWLVCLVAIEGNSQVNLTRLVDFYLQNN